MARGGRMQQVTGQYQRAKTSPQRQNDSLSISRRHSSIDEESQILSCRYRKGLLIFRGINGSLWETLLSSTESSRAPLEYRKNSINSNEEDSDAPNGAETYNASHHQPRSGLAHSAASSPSRRSLRSNTDQSEASGSDDSPAKSRRSSNNRIRRNVQRSSPNGFASPSRGRRLRLVNGQQRVESSGRTSSSQDEPLSTSKPGPSVRLDSNDYVREKYAPQGSQDDADRGLTQSDNAAKPDDFDAWDGKAQELWTERQVSKQDWRLTALDVNHYVETYQRLPPTHLAQFQTLAEYVAERETTSPFTDEPATPHESDCEDVAEYLLRTRFRPLKSAQRFVEALTAQPVEHRSTAALYALAFNAQEALEAWQDEYLELDARTASKVHPPKKPATGSRQPLDLELYEDMKEAELWGYNFDAKKGPGHQNPFRQRPDVMEANGGRELRQRRGKDVGADVSEDDGPANDAGKRTRRAVQRYDGEPRASSRGRKRALEVDQVEREGTPRKRGRPPGPSRNASYGPGNLLKPHLARHLREDSVKIGTASEAESIASDLQPRRRGRPPGSKNVAPRSDAGVKKGPRKPRLGSNFGSDTDATPAPEDLAIPEMPLLEHSPGRQIGTLVEAAPADRPSPQPQITGEPKGSELAEVDSVSLSVGKNKDAKSRAKSEKRSESMQKWWAARKKKLEEQRMKDQVEIQRISQYADTEQNGRALGQTPHTGAQVTVDGTAIEPADNGVLTKSEDRSDFAHSARDARRDHTPHMAQNIKIERMPHVMESDRLAPEIYQESRGSRIRQPVLHSDREGLPRFVTQQANPNRGIPESARTQALPFTPIAENVRPTEDRGHRREHSRPSPAVIASWNETAPAGWSSSHPSPSQTQRYDPGLEAPPPPVSFEPQMSPRVTTPRMEPVHPSALGRHASPIRRESAAGAQHITPGLQNGAPGSFPYGPPIYVPPPSAHPLPPPSQQVRPASPPYQRVPFLSQVSASLPPLAPAPAPAPLSAPGGPPIYHSYNGPPPPMSPYGRLHSTAMPPQQQQQSPYAGPPPALATITQLPPPTSQQQPHAGPFSAGSMPVTPLYPRNGPPPAHGAPYLPYQHPPPPPPPSILGDQSRTHSRQPSNTSPMESNLPPFRTEWPGSHGGPPPPIHFDAPGNHSTVNSNTSHYQVLAPATLYDNHHSSATSNPSHQAPNAPEKPPRKSTQRSQGANRDKQPGTSARSNKGKGKAQDQKAKGSAKNAVVGKAQGKGKGPESLVEQRDESFFGAMDRRVEEGKA